MILRKNSAARWAATLSVALIVVANLAPAEAENVDLATVPTRQSVQLTIYNSEDLTLVRETRAVTFKKGVNPLQFSWANTLIDPSSVELKFLTHPDQLDLLDTTFPHAKPQMLYWNVQSELDGEATIQITYFTSGITWSADYTAIANKEETAMSLEGFVRVHNNSGEEYENAQVRLVVGTINLVEKIAQLAGVPQAPGAPMAAAPPPVEKKTAFRRELAKSDSRDGAEAKQIVKEGLSEYFIFTIEGVETVKTGWSKRLRSQEALAAPFKVQYRYRPQEYGEQLVRMYLLKNDKASQLGDSPLPDGVVRVFRDNGQGGLSYLTQQAIKYIPIGDKIELNLGADPEVIFELVKLRVSRDNLWLQIHGQNEFRQIGGDGVIKVENASLVGWSDHEVYSQRIRNYTAKPIDVEIRRAFPGHVLFRSSLLPKLHDYQTVELNTVAPAGKKTNLLFEVVRRQGNQAKQNNVTLEAAEVQP